MKGGIDVSKLKREIIALIDESSEQVYKIAFYSDPKVSSIMDRLISKWERNQQKGIPLDYATEDEVRTLHDVAVKIARIPPQELQSMYLRRIMPGGGGWSE